MARRPESRGDDVEDVDLSNARLSLRFNEQERIAREAIESGCECDTCELVRAASETGFRPGLRNWPFELRVFLAVAVACLMLTGTAVVVLLIENI